jgi:hypothetical protein
LPTGEAVSQLIHEAYPEDYHGPSDENSSTKEKFVYPKDKK